jgi:Nucleotidyltransferase of unknown function (DUF6036)
MDHVREFFLEIDERWKPMSTHKPRLCLIGCGALMLQANYVRGTKDSDLFETSDLDAATKKQLLEIAGPGTDLHQRRRVYLDIVANGIPFLPREPTWNAIPAVSDGCRHFEVVALDIVDVVVSKLKRFHANDQSDIDAMIQRGMLSHEALLRRFRSAVDHFRCDARAEDLPRYVQHLHRVERDMLDAEETEIDLPSWI